MSLQRRCTFEIRWDKPRKKMLVEALSEVSIELNGMPSGVYTLEVIRTTTGIESLKFVVTHSSTF